MQALTDAYSDDSIADDDTWLDGFHDDHDLLFLETFHLANLRHPSTEHLKAITGEVSSLGLNSSLLSVNGSVDATASYSNSSLHSSASRTSDLNSSELQLSKEDSNEIQVIFDSLRRSASLALKESASAMCSIPKSSPKAVSQSDGAFDKLATIVKKITLRSPEKSTSVIQQNKESLTEATPEKRNFRRVVKPLPPIPTSNEQNVQQPAGRAEFGSPSQNPQQQTELRIETSLIANPLDNSYEDPLRMAFALKVYADMDTLICKTMNMNVLDKHILSVFGFSTDFLWSLKVITGYKKNDEDNVLAVSKFLFFAAKNIIALCDKGYSDCCTLLETGRTTSGSSGTLGRKSRQKQARAQRQMSREDFICAKLTGIMSIIRAIEALIVGCDSRLSKKQFQRRMKLLHEMKIMDCLFNLLVESHTGTLLCRKQKQLFANRAIGSHFPLSTLTDVADFNTHSASMYICCSVLRVVTELCNKNPSSCMYIAENGYFWSLFHMLHETVSLVNGSSTACQSPRSRRSRNLLAEESRKKASSTTNKVALAFQAMVRVSIECHTTLLEHVVRNSSAATLLANEFESVYAIEDTPNRKRSGWCSIASMVSGWFGFSNKKKNTPNDTTNKRDMGFSVRTLISLLRLPDSELYKQALELSVAVAPIVHSGLSALGFITAFNQKLSTAVLQLDSDLVHDLGVALMKMNNSTTDVRLIEQCIDQGLIQILMSSLLSSSGMAHRAASTFELRSKTALILSAISSKGLSKSTWKRSQQIVAELLQGSICANAFELYKQFTLTPSPELLTQLMEELFSESVSAAVRSQTAHTNGAVQLSDIRISVPPLATKPTSVSKEAMKSNDYESSADEAVVMPAPVIVDVKSKDVHDRTAFDDDDVLDRPAADE